jgi:hypothetical protein
MAITSTECHDRVICSKTQIWWDHRRALINVARKLRHRGAERFRIVTLIAAAAEPFDFTLLRLAQLE